MTRPGVPRPRCAVPGCRVRAPGGWKNVSVFTVPKDSRRRAWLNAIKTKYSKRKLLVCQLHFASEDIVFNNKRNRVITHAVPSLPGSDGEEDGEAMAIEQDVVEDMPEVKPEVKPEPPDSSVIVDLFKEEETVVQERTLRERDSTFLCNSITVKQERNEETATSEDDGRFHEEIPVYGVKERFAAPQTLETPTNSKETDLDLLIKLSKVHFSPELAKTIEVQALLKSELKAAFGTKNYSKQMIFFAIRLYHSYPNTYKLMHESLLLPSMMKIRQLCRNLNWDSIDSWTRMLQARFECASVEDRECVVCVAKVRLSLGLSYDPVRDRMAGLDEMNGVLTPRIARYATVVYARGILSRWRQPLSYALSYSNSRPERVWLWLEAIILTLFDIGLNVRALVTDFDEHFNPIVGPSEPGKTYLQVKDKQIYCFYDCTQLMVKFRDCFRMYNINFKGMMATWDDIEELYQYDSLRRYKLAAELTNEHVQPSGIAGRQVKVAMETLSPEVAAALAAAVDLRVLNDSAHGTVQLILTFSSLYNVLHSKELAVERNKINRELRFLHDMLVNFEKITFMDKNRMRNMGDPGVLHGFNTDVRSAMALQERMRRAGYDALPMRAFNNDPIHQFSDRLRGLNANKDPTGRQLIDGFRRSFTFNILKSFSKDGKLGGFLEAASGVKNVGGEVIRQSIVRGLVKPSHIAELMRVPMSAHYLLLRQCLRLKPCCELGRHFCKQVPPAFVEYMIVVERKFRLYFSTDCIRGGIMSTLLASLSEHHFPTPCNCFPVLFLNTLYLRFRIADLVQYNNTKFRLGISRDFTMNLRINAK